jgi:hypothetical protein
VKFGPKTKFEIRKLFATSERLWPQCKTLLGPPKFELFANELRDLSQAAVKQLSKLTK